MATISHVPQKKLWGLYKVYKTCISTIMVLRLWKRAHLVTYPSYQLWNLVETKSLTSAMLPLKTLDNLRQLIWVAIICRGFHLELFWVSFTVNQKSLQNLPISHFISSFTSLNQWFLNFYDITLFGFFDKWNYPPSNKRLRHFNNLFINS